MVYRVLRLLQIPIARTVHRLRLFLATGIALLVPSTTATARTFHYSNSSYLPLQQHQLPLQQQQLSVFFMLYTPQLLRRLICTTVHVGTAVRQLVLLCEKKLSVRHLFLAPSLRAPVRTAAVYVPTLTYAAVYPTDVVVIGTALSTYRQYYVREHVPVPYSRYAVEFV